MSNQLIEKLDELHWNNMGKCDHCVEPGDDSSACYCGECSGWDHELLISKVPWPCLTAKIVDEFRGVK